MKSAILISLLLVVGLVGSARSDGILSRLFKVCPKAPCPDGQVCVSVGYLHLCRKPAAEGRPCSNESMKLKDDTYDGFPPCQEGLKCHDLPNQTCQK